MFLTKTSSSFKNTFPFFTISDIGYCTLSYYEQKTPPFYQYSSLMGHNMLCKQVTKKAISGKCAFKDFLENEVE
jgi:hypothetical protein